jgi:Ni2+-binding GTPase involved in maturation of urease and hydrogenase
MTNDRAALREKVVMALDETFTQAARRGMWNVSREYDCAVVANDVVLEEAARVAEGTSSYDDNVQKSAGCHTTGQRIAAAIRAMKS